MHTHKYSSIVEKEVDRKGPGCYDIDISSFKSGTKITISKKGVGPKPPNELIHTPGPGTYDPLIKASMSRSQSCSMFWHRPSTNKGDKKLGPGSYEIVKELGNPQIGIQ